MKIGKKQCTMLPQTQYSVLSAMFCVCVCVCDVKLPNFALVILPGKLITGDINFLSKIKYYSDWPTDPTFWAVCNRNQTIILSRSRHTSPHGPLGSGPPRAGYSQRRKRKEKGKRRKKERKNERKKERKKEGERKEKEKGKEKKGKKTWDRYGGYSVFRLLYVIVYKALNITVRQ